MPASLGVLQILDLKKAKPSLQTLPNAFASPSGDGQRGPIGQGDLVAIVVFDVVPVDQFGAVYTHKPFGREAFFQDSQGRGDGHFAFFYKVHVRVVTIPLAKEDVLGLDVGIPANMDTGRGARAWELVHNEVDRFSEGMEYGPLVAER